MGKAHLTRNVKSIPQVMPILSHTLRYDSSQITSD